MASAISTANLSLLTSLKMKRAMFFLSLLIYDWTRQPPL
jgi:hypothetical protein